VYIPVAAKKRKADFLEPATRLAVARIWRTAASAPFEPTGLLMVILFTQSKCHDMEFGTTRFWA
jgi:hypothetical protein